VAIGAIQILIQKTIDSIFQQVSASSNGRLIKCMCQCPFYEQILDAIRIELVIGDDTSFSSEQNLGEVD